MVTVEAAADEYEVEAIVDERRVDLGSDPARQEYEYLVRWKGFRSNEDQWMPMASLQDCQDVHTRWVNDPTRPEIWSHKTDPLRWNALQPGAVLMVYDSAHDTDGSSRLQPQIGGTHHHQA